MQVTDWTKPDLSIPETDRVIAWMDRIIRLWKDELKERCQETIGIHLITSAEYDLEELGSVCWYDFTSHAIIRTLPIPDIDPEKINWTSVAKFLVERLKLALFDNSIIDEYQEED